MPNPSNQTNPLDYPRYVRGLRPALPDSLGDYVETELEKIQNSMENMAVATDANTKTQVAQLGITVDGNTSAIIDEQTVRADADQTLSDRITTIESTPSGNTIYRQADQPSEAGTYSDGDMWFDTDDNNKLYIYDAPSATWVLSADQRIDTNLALIQQESQTRANDYSAMSTQITDLTTTVNGNTASIDTVQTSLNGIQAKYGVQLDVNGYITGFEQNNDGTTGDFIIRADTFAVVDPAAAPGDPGMAPFAVVNGVVKINGEELKNNSVPPDALDVQSLSAITATIGTLKTASSGARVEIHDNLIEVYDANRLRVRMGVW